MERVGENEVSQRAVVSLPSPGSRGPGRPAQAPRLLAKACACLSPGVANPRSLLGRCSVPGSVVGTAFTASLGGRHFAPSSAHRLVHPLTPMFAPCVLAARTAPSPGAVRGEGDRGGPGQARGHTPDPHLEAAELQGSRVRIGAAPGCGSGLPWGADRGCRV